MLEEFGAQQGVALQLGVVAGDAAGSINHEEVKKRTTIWIRKDGGEPETSYGHHSKLQ